MTTLPDILATLDAAVRAGEAACAALAWHDAPAARLLLQKAQIGTAQHRDARDILRAAILHAKKLPIDNLQTLSEG
jgi:hypothetical protein